MEMCELTALSKNSQKNSTVHVHGDGSTWKKTQVPLSLNNTNSTLKARCYLISDIANSCICFRPISPLVWYCCRKKFSRLKILRKRANPQNTGLLLQVCLLCNPTALVCNTRKNRSAMFTGKMATGMYFINILYRIYEKMKNIKEIIQKIISMNNFYLNSTDKVKDCIVIIAPNYSELRDKL